MTVNDLSVEDAYDNFIFSSMDFYELNCKIGDFGYFGNSVEEVNKNMKMNNIQKLDDFLIYGYSPFISEGKQYAMYYNLRNKK